MRFLLLALALSACSRPLDVPNDQVECTQFHDDTSCRAAGCDVGPSCSCPNEPTSCVPKGAFVDPPSCSGECATTIACGDLTDAASCNARSDCWALLTFDKRCDSMGCSPQFVSCKSGQPLCNVTGCGLQGGMFTCDGSTSVVSNQADDCGVGCVDSSKCPAS